MSSGGAAIVPMAIVFAAGAVAAVVVVAAVGTAVLIAYAANQAAEGAVQAVGRRGEKLEALAESQSEAEANSLRWQAAAADVVGLNARLRLMAASARQAGVPLDMPPPRDLAGCSREQAVSWARKTERELAAAQCLLDEKINAARWHHLVAGLAATAPALTDPAEALDAYQATLRRRRVAATAEPAPARVVPLGLAAILHRLDPDATVEEQTRVMQAAARAEAQQEPHDADTYRRALVNLVDHDINVKVARRRLAAEWLEALEQPDVSDAFAKGYPPSPFSGTAGKLLAVVDGTAELTDDLRVEATAAVASAGDITRQAFVRDMVLTCLVDAGYSVHAVSSGPHAIKLQAERSDWHGEHSADVWVGRDGVVEGRLVRELDEAGDEAEARDGARCADFNAALESLAVADERVTVRTDRGRAPLRRSARGQAQNPVVVPGQIVRTHKR